MTLTKADLVDKLLEEFGMNKVDAKRLVDQFFEEMKNALEKGHAVKLPGFGNFTPRDKKQRPGRNPKTGEVFPVTARRVVTFKASPKLKIRVKDPGSKKQ